MMQVSVGATSTMNVNFSKNQIVANLACRGRRTSLIGLLEDVSAKLT